MSSLRQRLERDSPTLYKAFQRSWDIAVREWLPAIASSEGSYNSLPHFENIEYHLESLLGAAAESPATTLKLSVLEIYLLLASVLFHDFGRVYGDADHADASAKKLPEHFNALGIPSIELAGSLSRIALFHDPLTAKDKLNAIARNEKLKFAKKALRDVRIEPFGSARELYVGTLLALADHMDASTRRAAPRYIVQDERVGFKGGFRRLVSGTGYDPATYSLKTSLSGFEGSTELLEFEKLYPNFLRMYHRSTPGVQPDQDKNIPLPEMKGGEQTVDLYDRMIKACDPPPANKTPSAMFFKSLLARTSKSSHCYVLERKITQVVQTKEQTPVSSLWPADFLLAVVLNDLHANNIFLDSIRNELDQMGLPVHGWFIEFGSEVFDHQGNLTHEPTLPVEFLIRVAEEMWFLGCKLLVSGFVTYDVLADSLRIENVSLARLAAQRIACMIDAQPAIIIIAGTSGWRWNKPESGQWSEDVALKPILDALHKLKTNSTRT